MRMVDLSSSSSIESDMEFDHDFCHTPVTTHCFTPSLIYSDTPTPQHGRTQSSSASKRTDILFGRLHVIKQNHSLKLIPDSIRIPYSLRCAKSTSPSRHNQCPRRDPHRLHHRNMSCRSSMRFLLSTTEDQSRRLQMGFTPR